MYSCFSSSSSTKRSQKVRGPFGILDRDLLSGFSKQPPPPCFGAAVVRTELSSCLKGKSISGIRMQELTIKCTLTKPLYLGILTQEFFENWLTRWEFFLQRQVKEPVKMGINHYSISGRKWKHDLIFLYFALLRFFLKELGGLCACKLLIKEKCVFYWTKCIISVPGRK